MYACIIIHNMILKDKGMQMTNWSPEDEASSSSNTNDGIGASKNFQFFLEGKPTFVMLEPMQDYINFCFPSLVRSKCVSGMVRSRMRFGEEEGRILHS